MSGLWTPGGGAAGGGAWGGEPPRPPEPDPAEVERALQEELAAIRNTPAEYVVGNHAIQLFELARIHLTADPPNLAHAALAIDAMAAIVEGLSGRLGDDERTLSDGLAQIRLAFVQLKASVAARDPQPGAQGAGRPSAGEPAGAAAQAEAADTAGEPGAAGEPGGAATGPRPPD